MEKRVEVIRFNGIKFRRYPDAPSQPDRRYYVPGIGDRQRGYKRLHEEIWMHANGVDSIPDGHHIHHVDHDYSNNDPSNLELISAEEHQKHHMAERLRSPEGLEFARFTMDYARQFASEWHKSEEGREWHRKRAREVWDNMEKKEAVCEQCGDSYESYNPGRFCSNKCKSAWRRDSGIDDVDRPCAHCGTLFRVNKYSKIKCCSGSCGAHYRAAQRAARLQPDGQR